MRTVYLRRNRCGSWTERWCSHWTRTGWRTSHLCWMSLYSWLSCFLPLGLAVRVSMGSVGCCWTRTLAWRCEDPNHTRHTPRTGAFHATGLHGVDVEADGTRTLDDDGGTKERVFSISFSMSLGSVVTAALWLNSTRTASMVYSTTCGHHAEYVVRSGHVRIPLWCSRL